MIDKPVSDTAKRATRVLIPFEIREALTLRAAADIAGRTPRHIQNLCILHGIGRQVLGNRWLVSRVALAMLLEDDTDALAAYRDWGVRASYAPVAKYFRRLDLGDLLDRPEFAI